MRICRRRRAQRAVFIAGKSCIGRITIANLVVAPNGSDAIAIVVPKKIVAETVRFLGRRIYASLVVVLITTMIHGLSKDEAAGSGKHRKSTRARIRRSYKVPPFAF